MFGFFELFGASRAQRKVDAAFREVGVHPRLVPDAVKISIIRQLQSDSHPGAAGEAACAEILGYLMHGSAVFAEDNGAYAMREVQGRIESAISAGDSPDARLVLLALHAGIVAPEVIDEYELGID
jgi:hypothetical protein